jgi:hypothetical protein
MTSLGKSSNRIQLRLRCSRYPIGAPKCIPIHEGNQSIQSILSHKGHWNRPQYIRAPRANNHGNRKIVTEQAPQRVWFRKQDMYDINLLSTNEIPYPNSFSYCPRKVAHGEIVNRIENIESKPFDFIATCAFKRQEL